MQKIKCSQILYKGLAIPASETVHTNSAGREFYISGRSWETPIATATVRYIDDGTFETVQLSRLTQYINPRREK